MSSDQTAISVRGLSKGYDISHQQDPATTVAEAIMRRVRRPFQRMRKERFWALRDLSLQVNRGEVVGIVGRNGAGKSTLLKIMSRITPPTHGAVDMHGRVGSLLEVGTGFHRELTGRENIYLNGGILGMSRREITAQFDQIVQFAGVERFLDTPVKRYSSGMYVRLAFAVAAHLRPEILLVDEVLAVGDARFQEKCLDKMKDVSRTGRTVLFVSHNMNAVLNLCTRAVLLEDGRLTADGSPRDIVGKYLSVARHANTFAPEGCRRRGDQAARIVGFDIAPDEPATGAPLRIAFDVERGSDAADNGDALPAELGVGLFTEDQAKVLQMYSRHIGWRCPLRPGRTRVVAELDRLPLVPGRYRLNLWLGSGQRCMDLIEDCFVLEVKPGRLDGDAYIDNNGFPLALPMRWRSEPRTEAAASTHRAEATRC